MNFSFDWHLWRQSEKFLAVSPGEVGDRADGAFFPQDFIGKRRDITHVDAAAHNDSSFADGPKRLGNEVANRRENDRCIQLRRWQFIGATGPNSAKSKGKFLRVVISWPRESINLALLVFCHLCDDMCRRAESVDPEALAIAGFDEDFDIRSNPAHSSGAASASPYESGIGKQKR